MYLDAIFNDNLSNWSDMPKINIVSPGLNFCQLDEARIAKSDRQAKPQWTR